MKSNLKGFLILFPMLLLIGCVTGKVTLDFDALEGPFLVTKIIDGDTLDLENGQRIRFSGINTPETGECYYSEAKEKLSELVLDGKVFLEKDKSDEGKYGRKLRYVYLNESGMVFVNGILVEEGFAKVYDKYKKDTKRYSQLKVLESSAKAKKIGVWSCEDKKTSCLFVGSKNSDKYHTSECKHAKKIKNENLVCFQTLEEAKGSGKEFSGC